MSRRHKEYSGLYATKRLAEGYPDIGRLALEHEKAEQGSRVDHAPRLTRTLEYLNRLVNLDEMRRVVVIGCGAEPQTVKILLSKGFHATGIEPVRSYVESAHAYLGRADAVLEGAAERVPLPDGSQDFVLCESVMEHVDSPVRSVEEMFRILAPGGIACIDTSNRHRFRILGQNSEFNVPYYNWLPRLVKECYVHHHLHYKPSLANYTTRPAVHWYSYEDLCRLGRNAGFAKFYSLLDLVGENDATIRSSWLRRFLIGQVKYRPWLRALALTQFGGGIVMLKRPE